MGKRIWPRVSYLSVVLITLVLIFTLPTFLDLLPHQVLIWGLILSIVAFSYTVCRFKKEEKLKSEALESLEQLRHNFNTLEQEMQAEQDRMNTSLVLEIRAHTQAENRLRDSEEKYRNLVNSLPDGIFIVQDHRIVFFNPGLQALTGLNSEELYATDPEFLFRGRDGEFLSPDGPDLIFQKGGDHPRVYIETQWVEIRFDERLARLYAVRDITERVLAAKEKDRLELELEKAKKMEALGLMAAGVAHDLNNVLSGIVSTPELLLMELPQESDLREMVLTMKESGNRATVIVDELLTLGRGAARVREHVCLNQVIQDYLDSPEYGKSCDYHPNVELETVLGKDLPGMKGSGLHMRKVVMNLVSNAMEAIRGRGKVTLTTDHIFFDGIFLDGDEKKRDGDHIRLRVADTGPGICPEDLERIFEPFYTKKILGRSGTGLGLSIVWNIVHDHNGAIEVNSNEGGTRFDIYLPASLDLKDEEKPERIYTLSDYEGNNEIILVVDDEKNQLKITSNMLSRMGYRTVTMESGEAAIDYLSAHKVDLVILDMIMMPGIDGLSTYQQLRAIDPEIRAILASGYSKTPEVDAAQELGAGTFIKKPFSLQTLGLAVKEELERQ